VTALHTSLKLGEAHPDNYWGASFFINITLNRLAEKWLVLLALVRIAGSDVA